MAKKRLELTIDEFILKKAKEEIPNLSGLFEDVLKTMLQTRDTDEFQIKTRINAEKEQIVRSEKQIELLEGQLKIRRDFKYRDKKEEDTAWRGIYDPYRKYGHYEEEQMNHAIITLGWNKDELEELLYYLDLSARQLDATKIQTWNYIKEVAFKNGIKEGES